MEVTNILLVGIEVSIALAGFAGIIATFQMRDVTKVKRGNVAGLTLIVQYSLLAAMACGLALLLHVSGINGEALWASSSVIGALLTAYGAYSIGQGVRGVTAKRFPKLMFLLLQGLGILVVIALILNAVGLVFHRGPGPFVASILYALGVACFIFSRLLLVPLWRIVHEKEEANSRVTSPA